MTPESTALPAAVAAAVRAELGEVAEATVQEIIVEVPAYAEEFTGHMGQVIGNAVVFYRHKAHFFVSLAQFLYKFLFTAFIAT